MRPSAELEDALDLDRDAEGGRRPRRPSGVAAGFAQSGDKKSEAPLMTLGWSVKSAVELTKPVSLTARTSAKDRRPQAFFT